MEDVFGLACKAYFDGDKNAVITVNTNLTEDEEIPCSYLFRSFDKMPEFEQYTMPLCIGKVLDIGAGVGPHAYYLQSKNIDVTALEPSALCCEIMQQRGIKNIANTTLENYNPNSKFDTILLLMNGIGLAGKIDNLQKFLLKLKSLLSEKGKIYLTSADIAYMFIEEDGSMEIDLNGGYYGEMEYETSFNGNIANYDWLYLNADILFMHAEEIGLKGEVISQTEEGDYLAVLSFS